MPKLTDTQLVILSTAAQRDDGAVQPLPKSLKLQGGAAASTCSEEPAEEGPARGAAGHARCRGLARDAVGGRLMLVITDAGRPSGRRRDQAGVPNKQSAPPKALPSARSDARKEEGGKSEVQGIAQGVGHRARSGRSSRC